MNADTLESIVAMIRAIDEATDGFELAGEASVYDDGKTELYGTLSFNGGVETTFVSA